MSFRYPRFRVSTVFILSIRGAHVQWVARAVSLSRTTILIHSSHFLFLLHLAQCVSLLTRFHIYATTFKNAVSAYNQSSVVSSVFWRRVSTKVILFIILLLVSDPIVFLSVLSPCPSAAWTLLIDSIAVTLHRHFFFLGKSSRQPILPTEWE
jgi:hypothetical protein